MQSIRQILTGFVSDAFVQCGYDAAFGQVTVSDRPDLCQFQCNGAFAGAKRYHKAPFVIAQEVAALLQQNTHIQRAEAMRPGFLNLDVTDAFLAQMVTALAGDEQLGIPQVTPGETIVLDYGGPNVAKPLHIGHLRAAIIGESLKRIARASGQTVYGDVHLGDWGLQMGLVIAELEVRNPQWRCFSDDFQPGRDMVATLDVEVLNELYPLASKKSKADPAFLDQARKTTQELQAGKPGYYALFQEILRVSITDMKEIYALLHVDFDLWYGESDAEQYVPELLEILQQKQLLRESDGALVVDVAQEDDKTDIPPVIIKKSDNSNIYATTDLATILGREKEFSPHRIWYVVDQRQSLHFTQVFRCAKKAALVPEATELAHLGFGTMNGSDGKPYKTRDGGVMRLRDLLDTVIAAAYEKLQESNFSSEEEKRAIAQKIGVAAIKFGDLSNHRAKDYIFDLDKFLSFEGKTGTYLLYTITRIYSILKKVDVEVPDVLSFDGIYTPTERALFLAILQTGEAFQHALREKAPNHICENAYQLASLFSSFYHDNHILTESDPNKQRAWLSLCRLVQKLLLLHLDVLGIEPVEHM